MCEKIKYPKPSGKDSNLMSWVKAPFIIFVAALKLVFYPPVK